MVGMREILDQVSAVSEQMVRFDLHKEEMLLLQATVLANAGKGVCLLYGCISI